MSRDASWSSERTRSSAGPLTTVFTPPAHCSEVMALLDASGNLKLHAYMPREQWGDSYTSSNTCLPPGTPYRQTYGYFFPGVVCPASWTSAMTAVSSRLYHPGWSQHTATAASDTAAMAAAVQSLLPGETEIWCCPP